MVESSFVYWEGVLRLARQLAGSARRATLSIFGTVMPALSVALEELSRALGGALKVERASELPVWLKRRFDTVVWLDEIIACIGSPAMFVLNGFCAAIVYALVGSHGLSRWEGRLKSLRRRCYIEVYCEERHPFSAEAIPLSSLPAIASGGRVTCVVVDVDKVREERPKDVELPAVFVSREPLSREKYVASGAPPILELVEAVLELGTT